MRYRIQILTGALLIISLSCREKDGQPPLVSILSPTQSQLLTFGSSVDVEFEASDETGIAEITVSVTDYQGRLAAGPLRIAGNGEKLIRKTVSLPFTDVRIESGEYILRVRATDGVREDQDVLGMTLQGAARALRRMWVMRQSGSFQTSLDSLGEQNELVPGKVVDGVFRLAAANSWNQTIHLAGRTPDGIASFSGMDLMETATTVIPYGLGDDLFTDLVYDQNSHQIWLSSKDGIVREIDQNGSVAASFSAFHPEQILSAGDYLYIYGDNGLIRKIEVYLKSTGQLLQSLQVADPVIDLLPLGSADKMLVVRGSSATDPLIPYNRQGNFLDAWTPFSTGSSSPVKCGCAGASGVFIAHADGIHLYTNDGNETVQSALVSNPVSMVYDEPGQLLWILEEDLLHSMSVSGGLTPFNTYSTGGDARALILLYNK